MKSQKYIEFTFAGLLILFGGYLIYKNVKY